MPEETDSADELRYRELCRAIRREVLDNAELQELDRLEKIMEKKKKNSNNQFFMGGGLCFV